MPWPEEVRLPLAPTSDAVKPAINRAMEHLIARAPQQYPQAQPDSPRAHEPFPALLEYDGKKEIVVSGGDVVTGHDLVSGKELWRAHGLNPGKARNYRIVASPVVAGGLVIAPTRIRPMIAIKPGGRGDITATHVAWRLTRGVPNKPSILLVGDLPFFGQFGFARATALCCFAISACSFSASVGTSRPSDQEARSRAGSRQGLP